MIFETLLCAIAACLVAFYYYATKNYNFWKSRGVYGPKPEPFFGNFRKVLVSRIAKPFVLHELYNAHPHDRIVGIYDGRQPALLLRDPELFDQVFKRNFPAFGDRGMLIHEKADPFSMDLFCLDAERWWPVRRKLSPGFASGRLRGMFPIVMDCADVLDVYLENLVLRTEVINVRDVFVKYALNVIGTCAFGIDLQALKDENSEYHKICEDALRSDFAKTVRLWLKITVPWFFDILGYVMPYTKLTKFFLGIVRSTLRERKANNVVKYDFVHQLQVMKDRPEELGPRIQVNDLFLAAQAFVFFTAGFDATSIALTNVFYELAQNHDIQEKLREEIQQAYKKNNGVFTYESVSGMKYLDKVYRETLRKHSPITMVHRQSTDTYTFKELNLTIPKGVKVFASISGLHLDPNIYPNPDVFDPERFNEEEVACRHPNTFIPFGLGPRMCLGARFSYYMAKVGVCRVLRKFRFDVCEKTEIPYKKDLSNILMLPVGGIYLKVSIIKNSD